LAYEIRQAKILKPVNGNSGGRCVKDKTPVVKQLYRLSVEPRIVDQLAKLATRTGEPRSRLAARLFTEAVMSAKGAARPAKPGRSEAKIPR
jgi:hypothetical protein